MGKRFTDTGLNREPWFRRMKPKFKCAIRFLFDECDVAGVWVEDMETLSYFVGEKITAEDLFKNVNSDKENRIEKFGGNKIFIPGFVSFQYGTLSENCKPHKPILEKLKKYGLLERVLKGYPKGIDTLEEKETDKEEEKETEEAKGGAGGKPEEATIVLAENVTMREKDYSTLLKKLGTTDTARVIAKLDAHKKSKNVKYVSDYGAINSWVIDWLNDQKRREAAIPQQKQPRHTQILTAHDEYVKSLQQPGR